MNRLIDFLKDELRNKYSGALTTNEQLITKKMYEEVVKVLESGSIYDTGNIIAESSIRPIMENKKIFKLLKISDADKNNIKLDNIKEGQWKGIKEVLIKFLTKKTIVIRPRKTSPTLESIDDYEDYLDRTYPDALKPNQIVIDATSPIIDQIRKKYPHEETPESDKAIIIYNPDTPAAKKSIKEYYQEFYEDQITRITPSTTIDKNKTHLLNLLNEIKSSASTAYCVNNVDQTTIDEIITELNNDTTDQTIEAGNTKLEIPGKFIIGHITEKYTIIVKNETYNRIKDKLNNVFGNKARNNITVINAPTNSLTVRKIKERNRSIVENLNITINKIQSNGNNMGTQNLSLELLKKIRDILNFDESAYTSPSDFTELIGGYVPTAKLDEFMKIAKELVKKDINFDFLGTFKNFVPIVKPAAPPTDPNNIQAIEDYEVELKKKYRELFPELFFTADYNYKRGRKKYPHEMFKWKGTTPSIEESNESEYSRYYSGVYGDYQYYRKNERLVKKITKAPSKLIQKIFDANTITRTMRDIGTSMRLEPMSVAENGDHGTYVDNVLKGVSQRLKINAIIAALGVGVYSLAIGFSSSAIPIAATGAGVVTLAQVLIDKIIRIHKTYKELREARETIVYSRKGLEEAEKYKRAIAGLDPTRDRDKIELYEKLIKAHIAYYEANYRIFLENYKRMKKSVQADWADEKQNLENERTAYKADPVFNSLWTAGEAQINRYSGINKDEFDKKIEAIKSGRSKY